MGVHWTQAIMESEIRVHINAGREHYLAAEYQKALPHLTKVLEHHDDFADIHNMLGICLQHLSRTDEARLNFERALELNPAYTEAALNLAVCYNELGRYDDAKAVYERAAEGRESRATAVDNLDGYVRGKLANLHRELGLAYEGVGMLAQAVEQFRCALQLCPTFVDIRTKLATTLRDAGHIDEAIDELIGVRDAKPEYLAARLHLGVTFWSAKRKDEARAEWKAVLEFEPDNARAQMYLRMAGEGST
ncbi:tetratricopeptide repeat protein [Enhygromyxa salina]|nr:tetratricopeptide repeat protein [Enhygromyxa salina]